MTNEYLLLLQIHNYNINHIRCFIPHLHLLTISAIGCLSCGDPEVRHSNMEESALYFIRTKYNLF